MKRKENVILVERLIVCEFILLTPHALYFFYLSIQAVRGVHPAILNNFDPLASVMALGGLALATVFPVNPLTRRTFQFHMMSLFVISLDWITRNFNRDDSPVIVIAGFVFGVAAYYYNVRNYQRLHDAELAAEETERAEEASAEDQSKIE